MTALFVTLGLLTAFIVACERLCWGLCRRKMEPLRFPSENDPSASHFFWLGRMRTLAVMHTIALLAAVWAFCIFLWR